MNINKKKLINRIEKALFMLHDWVQKNGWYGYDPYDYESWHNRIPDLLDHCGFYRNR